LTRNVTVPRQQWADGSIKSREEQPNMTDEKVIMLIEAKIQPQRSTELSKKFLATLKSAQAGDRVRTNLVELARE